MVVGPDGAPGLVISEGKVLVEANALIGMVTPGGGLFERLIFRDCTCGQRPRKCVCGARTGRVLHPSRADGVWTVVQRGGADAPAGEDEQHELGHITLRWCTTGRGDARAGGAGARLARWGRAVRIGFSGGPMGCELVEVGPGFDWHRHGLFVALAILCDAHAYHLSFPQRGGG